ncbi:MAG: hypothetical protein WC309_04095 [Candidatus Paceibacterota bacterium]|jgi:hypothetical protein
MDIVAEIVKILKELYPDKSFTEKTTWGEAELLTTDDQLAINERIKSLFHVGFYPGVFHDHDSVIASLASLVVEGSFVAAAVPVSNDGRNAVLINLETQPATFTPVPFRSRSNSP